MKKITNSSKQSMKVLLISLLILGCDEEFLNMSPATQVSDVDALATTNTLGAIMKGTIREWRTITYAMNMSGGHSWAINRDAMGPDIIVGQSWWKSEVAYSTYTQGTNRVKWNWWLFYKAINNANIVIANVAEAEGTQADKDRIKGEALAIRGFSYYELVTTYAPTYSRGASSKGVPIYLEPTTPETKGNARSTVEEVYTQVIADYTAAKGLLTASRGDKGYVNTNVIDGMLARLYLTMGNYAAAASSANSARQGYPLMSQAQWTSGFNDISNPEWIWGQHNTVQENPDWGGVSSQFDLEGSSNEASLHASDALVSLYSATDIRKSTFYVNTTGFWASRKFRQGATTYEGDYPYMRSAEMYLIEAEAQERTGNSAGAQASLFAVQGSRDASAVSSVKTGQALIDEIITEKRRELWGEGVHFSDMLRTGIALERDALHNEVMSKPANSWEYIFQIPEMEFMINENLDLATDQNPSTGTY